MIYWAGFSSWDDRACSRMFLLQTRSERQNTNVIHLATVCVHQVHLQWNVKAYSIDREWNDQCVIFRGRIFSPLFYPVMELYPSLYPLDPSPSLSPLSPSFAKATRSNFLALVSFYNNIITKSMLILSLQQPPFVYHYYGCGRLLILLYKRDWISISLQSAITIFFKRDIFKHEEGISK